jgi:hypothetical protein
VKLMKRIPRLAALLPALAFLSFSCANKANFLAITSSDYHRVLDRKTQERRFFGLEKVEFATFVTYRTPELRKAYVKEYAERYRLPAEKADELLKRELAEAARYDVFFVSHYSSQPPARKLRPESNVWRLTLSTSPEATSGAEADLVQQEPSGTDPVTKYFYPFVTTWSSNYLVKFKRQAGGPALHLRMSGVLADLAMTFQRETESSDASDSPR